MFSLNTRGRRNRVSVGESELPTFVVLGHEVEDRGHDEHHYREQAEVVTRSHLGIDLGKETGQDVAHEDRDKEERGHLRLHVLGRFGEGELQANDRNAELSERDYHVRGHNPHRGNLPVGGQETGHGHGSHTDCGDKEADHHLCCGFVDLQLNPHHVEDRGQEDDEPRVQRLELIGVEPVQIHVILCKENPGSHRLVVDRPEENDECENSSDPDKNCAIRPLFLRRLDTLLRPAVGHRHFLLRVETLAHEEDAEGGGHETGREKESCLKSVFGANPRYGD